MRTISVALRESGVLLLGCLLNAIVAYLMDDGRPRPKMMPFANPLAALFIPIFVCFVRAGFVPKPSEAVSKLRSILYQVLIAFALISLLLFEIGVSLFLGAPGIPLNAWLIVAGFGVMYVTFLCLADMSNYAPKSELVQNLFSVDNLRQESRPTNQAMHPSRGISRFYN